MESLAPQTCAAFIDHQLLSGGSKAEVALAVKRASRPESQSRILIYDDATGREFDFDLSGSESDVLGRLASLEPAPIAADGEPAEEPRGRGRPRLGVVAREITLLPRHWEWLADQPGGASVALRKLVEQARRANGAKDRKRRAREAAYYFMSSMAGNFSGFEEASRALFADDFPRLADLISEWPPDVRSHLLKLAGVEAEPAALATHLR